jgi:hypothetical protein
MAAAHRPFANPSRSIRMMRGGATSTPPTLAPFRARLIARPRRRSNHGATIVLTATVLIPVQPTDIRMKTG